VIDPTIVQHLLQARTATSPLAALTPRGPEAVALMAEGRSNQAINTALYVSGKTVETYVRSIFQKLELAETPDDHRRVRAVLHWLLDAT
jgi:serine/threonine-protein kinase PknK